MNTPSMKMTLAAALAWSLVCLTACEQEAPAPPPPSTTADAGQPTDEDATEPQNPGELGDPCVSNPCAAGLVCDVDTVCRLARHQACFGAQECTHEQLCRVLEAGDTKTCQPAAAENDYCEAEGCGEGLVCDTHRCLPALAQLDDACRADPSGVGRDCEPPWICARHDDGIHRCREKGYADLHEACELATDCAEALVCCAQCTPKACKVGDGDPCVEHGDCLPNRLCRSDGTCGFRSGDGEDCQHDADCEGGLSCVSGQCTDDALACSRRSHCDVDQRCHIDQSEDSGRCVDDPGRALTPCHGAGDCAPEFDCIDGQCLGLSGRASCVDGRDCIEALCVERVCKTPFGDPCGQHAECVVACPRSVLACTRGEAGSPCDEEDDCVEGYRCGPQNHCTRGRFHDRCDVNDPADCAQGFSCSTSTATCLGEEDTRGCLEDNDCLSGLICLTEACQPPKQPGDYCARNDQGDPDDAMCADGLLCNEVTVRCQPRRSQGLGELCGRDIACIEGLQCIQGICGRG